MPRQRLFLRFLFHVGRPWTAGGRRIPAPTSEGPAPASHVTGPPPRLAPLEARPPVRAGIDKRALIRGKEATAAEVDYKLSNLVADSGFLPGVDHAVPPEVSLETFRFYVNYVRESWKRLLR